MNTLELLALIGSAQDKNTEIVLFINGIGSLNFTLDEFLNSHIKESYKETLNQNVKSFIFDDEALVIEL